MASCSTKASVVRCQLPGPVAVEPIRNKLPVCCRALIGGEGLPQRTTDNGRLTNDHGQLTISSNFFRQQLSRDQFLFGVRLDQLLKKAARLPGLCGRRRGQPAVERW